jgi:hypothetical protein
MVHQQEEELSAFCATGPQPDEVTNVLAGLGCSLAFSMQAEDEGAYMHLPPLPAQFHYEGPGGVRVIYLAGSDIALDRERFPEHRSRVWLFGDHDQASFGQAASVLALRWQLSWQRTGCSSSSFDEVA